LFAATTAMLQSRHEGSLKSPVRNIGICSAATSFTSANRRFTWAPRASRAA
jgi:hypothetical protein